MNKEGSSKRTPAQMALEAAKRSTETLNSFSAMLDKKTTCSKCKGPIDREDRECKKCKTKNPYWMH